MGRRNTSAAVIVETAPGETKYVDSLFEFADIRDLELLWSIVGSRSIVCIHIDWFWLIM